MTRLAVWLGGCLAWCLAWCLGAVPAVALAQPAGATSWRYALVGESTAKPLGQLVITADPGAVPSAGLPRAFSVRYAYKDNGRGPETVEQVRLADDGSLLSYRVQGTSTFGSAIDEHFAREAGRVRWQSPVDRGDRGHEGAALYAAMGGSPALDAVAVAALARRADRALPLLPSGRLSQRVLDRFELVQGGQRQRLQLLAHTGLGLSPNYLWATDEPAPRLFASLWLGWGALVAEGWADSLPQLRERQRAAEAALHRQHAAEWLQPLPGLTVVRNARVFDSAAARLGPLSDVYLVHDRISAVVPAGSMVPRAPDTEIDAAGRVMLPGLFDMHDHAWRGSGGLHLAAGVTTVRDMGNANDALQQLIAERQRRELAYPHIVPAGFIEGASPFSSVHGILVRTLDDAKAAVDWYAQRGYPMVKIYNSFPREFLRETVAYAHQRGLRVGGHVPAFLRADEVLDMGFDEVSHVNQLLLNFLVTPSTDTRTLDRFYLPAERLGELDLDSAPVRDFIAKLAARGTTVDLTLMTFQFLQQRDGEVPAEYADVMAHLPPDMQRGALAAQMKIPDDATARRYRAAVARLGQFAARLHAAGVTLVAGTDHTAGIVLHSELIGYARAGLTPAQALQVATYNGAKVSGTLGDRGEIRPGRRADLLLVDGEPTQCIEDIRRVALVITQGALLRPRQVHEALGIRPFTDGEVAVRRAGTGERR
ncbi:amidohydrolase family protein [Ideonella sp. DXS22W]|uniref:Amidohydrolase family protein n=1 Tax=Pseudaquabacterium inlustre TaxID=2984192 RepID=A0ABU9CDE9_9BURK